MASKVFHISGKLSLIAAVHSIAMDMDISTAMTKIVGKLSDLILCWIHVTTALIRPREHVEEKLCAAASIFFGVLFTNQLLLSRFLL